MWSSLFHSASKRCSSVLKKSKLELRYSSKKKNGRFSKTFLWILYLNPAQAKIFVYIFLSMCNITYFIYPVCFVIPRKTNMKSNSNNRTNEKRNNDERNRSSSRQRFLGKARYETCFCSAWAWIQVQRAIERSEIVLAGRLQSWTVEGKLEWTRPSVISRVN